MQENSPPDFQGNAHRLDTVLVINHDQGAYLMKKSNKRTLRLNKETLQHLDDEAIQSAQGGTDDTRSIVPVILSILFCPDPC